ncbi:hypothetical protein EN781_12820 [Mesorhizobium sp. M4A.F.Ca.ET.090.04.2.1]|uniref:hypothetical protein n=1 Tax=Mesorhizobium sp. M4A.F.Ca.ET.090.04.2.1 TaxID=2496663 RepID=UPI000FCBD9D4|nr:hypothetical protein [Mesorhizobium sp. M4A.F.Ca.ET.090.04.2.1]RVC44724.1 hypothetical protein EN781_12820 [Mesorhizobium sp. M4A.F.Ca.ET.090.04.2.1]
MDSNEHGWWRGKKAALVVAHPGHELRVHHWMETAKPLVLVLTDGSGHLGVGRLDRTAEVLAGAGARPAAAFFGKMADRDLYRAILAGEAETFQQLVDEMITVLAGEAIDYVAADAVEGFNPGHDVCRLLVNAALAKLCDQDGRELPNLEFPLEAGALRRETTSRGGIELHLDAGAFDRKLGAIANYPELTEEADRLRAAHGLASLGVERLSPVDYHLDISECSEQPPAYERWGEQRVQSGYYKTVLRFKEHVEPLARQLAP